MSETGSIQPRVVVSYVDRKGNRLAKAAFVNESDALIYWNALTDGRKRFLVMHTPDGKDVTEIAHAGYNAAYGYYGHAYALTEDRPIPPRTRDRQDAERRGWQFDSVHPTVA